MELIHNGSIVKDSFNAANNPMAETSAFTATPQISAPIGQSVENKFLSPD
jgi:hypothetical protein